MILKDIYYITWKRLVGSNWTPRKETAIGEDQRDEQIESLHSNPLAKDIRWIYAWTISRPTGRRATAISDVS